MVKKVLLLYLCCFSDLSISESLISSASAQKSKSKILGECGRCKALTSSFNHWLDQTSRGKFEGGDVSWEEAKLKSYSRSEVRLVEVQEGLCSELRKHKDDCYMLAEEAEQMLEQWWFHEDPSTSNLETWLCIETLKHCCPTNHFGESCLPCPLGKDERICNGHGICDGEGTRNGNGSCICNRGYVGLFCEKCSENTYKLYDSCESCHQFCDGCTGAGPGACISCKNGWAKDSGVCLDIDECLSPSTCNSNEYCINKEGSFSCKKCDKSCISCDGAGPLNCTSCEPNIYFLWNGKCIADSLKSEIVRRAIKQMTIYIALLLIPGILYKIKKSLAIFALILLAFYVYLIEKSLEHASTFDVYFNNLRGKEGPWSF